MVKLIMYMKNKIASLQFWLVKFRLRENVDYEVISSYSESERVGVRMLTGKYAGVLFKYSTLIVNPHDEAVIEFKTHVLVNPNRVDVKSNRFVRLSSNILRLLLLQVIQDGIENEDRKVDITESNEERSFYEESNPLLEKRVSGRKSRKKDVSGNKPAHSKVQQSSKRKRNKNSSPRKNKSHGK